MTESEQNTTELDEPAIVETALQRMVDYITSGQSKRDLQDEFDAKYPPIGNLPF